MTISHQLLTSSVDDLSLAAPCSAAAAGTQVALLRLVRTLVIAVILLLSAVPARADRGSCAALVEMVSASWIYYPNRLLDSASPACAREVEARGTFADLLVGMRDDRHDAEVVLACALHPSWSVATMASGLDTGRLPEVISLCLIGLSAAGPEAATIVDDYLRDHAIEGGKLNASVMQPLWSAYATPEYASHLWPVFGRALDELDDLALIPFVQNPYAAPLCGVPLDPDHAALCNTARARIKRGNVALEQQQRSARRHRIVARIWHRLPMLLGAAAYVAASHFEEEHGGHDLNIAGGAIALGTAGYTMAYAPASSVGSGLPSFALAMKETLYTLLGAGVGAGLASLAPTGSHVTTSTVEATVFSFAMLAGTW